MKKRVLSACVMLPFLVFLWIGKAPLLILVNIVALAGMWEFYRGFEKLDIKPAKVLGYISWGLLFEINFTHLCLGFDLIAYEYEIMLWLFVTAAMAVSSPIFLKDHNIYSGPVAALGAIYIAFLVNHVPLVRALEQGRLLVWLIFLISIGTDTAAFEFGRRFGKRKMAPAISPNKTMAGFYGGMLGGTLFCFLFALLFSRENMLIFAVMGFLGSFFSQGGDLIESAFKRKMGIKDFSNLIPGHGGIMDRFDSALFTGSFVFYFSLIFDKFIK